MIHNNHHNKESMSMNLLSLYMLNELHIFPFHIHQYLFYYSNFFFKKRTNKMNEQKLNKMKKKRTITRETRRIQLITLITMKTIVKRTKFTTKFNNTWTILICLVGFWCWAIPSTTCIQTFTLIISFLTRFTIFYYIFLFDFILLN